MKRYILRFRGQGVKPAADVEIIRSLPHVIVLDDTPRMLLVEASPDELQTAMKSLPTWVMTEERMIPLSDPRPKVIRKVSSKEHE